MWCDKLWMGVFSWQRKLCTSLLLDWSLVSTGQCSHVFFCQSSGSGCSPNSSTHCSVQGRICPCKNGSMDTFTILYHMCFPKVKRSPIVSTKQWSFLSPTQDAGLPWPWALGVPKKKGAASSNGYTKTHCGPMVAWSTRFRCLYKTWKSQKWPRTVCLQRRFAR